MGLVLCATVFSADSGVTPAKLELECDRKEVGKYQKLEFTIKGAADYTNAFDASEIDMSVELTTPGGQRLSIPAFFYQGYQRRRVTGRSRGDWLYPRGVPGWKARFAPRETGAYRAVAFRKDRFGLARSEQARFECVPSARKGFVRVSRRDPRFLEFSEGQPFFPIGQNLAFVGDQQYVTLSKAEGIFGLLAANGANYLRLWTCCEDWALAIEARKSAWGRSWDWRPPIVPMPHGENTNQRCVKLSSGSTVLNVSPSHPVALRAETRYVVSAKVRTEGTAVLRLQVHRTKPEKPWASTPDQAWRTFQHEFETRTGDFWLAGMSLELEGTGTAWVSDLSLKEAGGGPELLWEAEVNRPSRGFYNPLDSFMLDELLASAEQEGIYLQLCLLTRDLYINALKDPAGLEYARAIRDAQNLLRYAVARWGYSTSVAAWEYWNEMNPDLPTDAFYLALGQYLEHVDIYRHLRTTSTWGPSTKDCRHPQLDIADAHFYLRPSDKGRLADEVEAVLDRTRWLRSQAPLKPAHLGEFGLANEKWQPTTEMQRNPDLVDVHNALWASVLSGASGSALFWWWERLDQRNVYPLYRSVSAFVADVPWTGGELAPASASCADEQLRVVGLQSPSRAWVWLFHRAASWSSVVIEKRAPPEVPAAQVEVKGLPPGRYRIAWWDTREGKTVRRDDRSTEEGILRLSAPPFTRDIACQVRPH